MRPVLFRQIISALEICDREFLKNCTFTLIIKLETIGKHIENNNLILVTDGSTYKKVELLIMKSISHQLIQNSGYARELYLSYYCTIISGNLSIKQYFILLSQKYNILLATLSKYQYNNQS